MTSVFMNTNSPARAVDMTRLAHQWGLPVTVRYFGCADDRQGNTVFPVSGGLVCTLTHSGNLIASVDGGAPEELIPTRIENFQIRTEVTR